MFQVKKAWRKVQRYQMVLTALLVILLAILLSGGVLSLFLPYREEAVLVLPAGEQLLIRSYIAPEVSSQPNYWQIIVYRDGVEVSRGYALYVTVSHDAEQEWIGDGKNFWGRSVMTYLHLRPDHQW
ncbi:MAG: hypothetical protein Q8N84_03510 [bacterium]|nr:hypothetical protein [bacterium]